jgi:carbon monoxide dehydrogenase subunit G
VFEFLDDPSRLSEWFQGVREVNDITQTEERIGDSWSLKYSAVGMTFHVYQKVTEWEKNVGSALTMSGMFPGTLRTTMSCDGDSTTLTQRFDHEVKGGAFGQAMNKLFLERMNAKNAARALEDIKDLLEADSA